ncbi:hypothetical protein LIZ91_06285 [Enterococcus avium]|uniref:hypothetical protein n=1 Tax=Enterococcus avium TaxID=33945 RepID=UPI001D07C98D|nr:hypothetical protein [Enterococcus avium]MCB6916191.1 hypothetical protein [Enterococcus avium]MCQ4960047.1 hypothetical protein [Enterococcus avium]
MTNEDYLKQVKILLDKENVKPHLKVQILETVIELLEHYSVDFVRELLPSLFRK